MFRDDFEKVGMFIDDVNNKNFTNIKLRLKEQKISQEINCVTKQILIRW